ncbi:hypothetical protein [Halolamina sp. C58]|uniref:hypothetical protein n=1 Tax=Halolamina sp. C58 TaxID=3421640 RepID=UPI003EBAF03C
MSAGDRLPDTHPAQGLALAALLLFLGVLVVYLDRPGYTPLRLLLFGTLAGAAVLGTAGAVTGRAWLAAVGAGLLALLGLPQAVLWIFVLPTAGVLAGVSLLIALRERRAERG